MGIYKEIMPGKITVGGVEYPAIYNFEALAIMEDEIRRALHKKYLP